MMSLNCKGLPVFLHVNFSHYVHMDRSSVLLLLTIFSCIPYSCWNTYTLTVQIYPESTWDYTLSYCCKSNHLFYVERSDNIKQNLQIRVVRQKKVNFKLSPGLDPAIKLEVNGPFQVPDKSVLEYILLWNNITSCKMRHFYGHMCSDYVWYPGLYHHVILSMDTSVLETHATTIFKFESWRFRQHVSPKHR